MDRLPAPEPLATVEGAKLSASEAAQQALNGAEVISFTSLLSNSDYGCLLAYLPPDDESIAPLLQGLRAAWGAASQCATMFGYGPRYLHSTGQLHKGGPNSGVFVILTAEPASDLAIPDEPYSFGTLELAQALGDFQSLDRANRRVLHVHLPNRDVEQMRRILSALISAV